MKDQNITPPGAETFQAVDNQQSGMAEGQQERLQRRLLMIYRDNDLFRQYAPEIANALSRVGYQVIEKKFVQSESEEIIQKWAEENLETLKGSDLITDKTFIRSLPEELIGQIDQTMLAGDGGLDLVMDAATTKAVLGDTWKGGNDIEGQTHNRLETTKDLEEAKQIFLAIVRNVLANTTNRPDSVIILTSKMEEHGPFDQIRNEFRAAGGSAKAAEHYTKLLHEGVKRIFPDLPSDLVLTEYDRKNLEKLLEKQGVNTHEDYRAAEKQSNQKKMQDTLKITELTAQNEGVKRTYEEMERAAFEEMRQMYPHVKSANIIAQWLEEAGIPANCIHVPDALKDIVDNEGNNRWVIHDRHNFFNGDLKESDKVFSMPLSNFFESCQKSGLLKLESQALSQALNQVIEEKFKKV